MARGCAVGWRMGPSCGGALPRRRRTAARIHIGIAYASKRDQNRKWRFTLSCRADTPKHLLEKWGDKNRKPCPAGKTFGVIGPNGLYRTCLHSLPKGACL